VFGGEFKEAGHLFRKGFTESAAAMFEVAYISAANAEFFRNFSLRQVGIFPIGAEIIGRSDPFFEFLMKYTVDGKLDTIVDYRGMTTYKYDSRRRQASVVNPDGLFIRSSYDNQGNCTLQKTPLDSVAYGYDSLNRMLTIRSSSGVETNYFYDAVRRGSQCEVF
jgi:YD repeat-containing protein